MALNQLAIYNGALQLIGERRLNTLSDDYETRHELDAIWSLDPHYYCAELTKPLFSTTLDKLNSPTTTSTEHSFEFAHEIPSTYIDIVDVHRDGKMEQPIKRFVRDGNNILCDDAVIYLRFIDKNKLDTLTLWSQSFTRVVIAYMAFELAERINSASIDKVATIYERRVQTAIQLNNGDEPLTRPVDSDLTDPKLNVFNNALMIAGEPRLKALTDDNNNRYDLDSLWIVNPHHYCAEIVKPRFASKIVTLTDSVPSAQHDLDNVFTLPSDFIEVVGVYSDSRLDQPIERYIREGNTIACEYTNVYLRYITTTNVNDLTKWTQSFTRVVYTYLAKLLMERKPDTAGGRLEAVDTNFNTAVTVARSSESADEPTIRSKAPSTSLSDTWLPIYNDALLLLGEDQLISMSDDSNRRSILDVAVNAGVVETILEDIGWHWAITSTRITADPELEPEWGYQHAHRLPNDMVRFDGVWYDEYFQTPVRHYTDEDGVLFVDVDEIYIQYVSSVWLATPEKWKSSFKRFVAAKIAYDTMGRFSNADKNVIKLAYEQRETDMKSIDAQQSPPHIITRGNWSRTRGVTGYGRGRP